MAPPRKRTRNNRTSSQEENVRPSLLLSDYRTAWLVKSDDQAVEVKAGGETFRVSKSVMTRHSDFFVSCFRGPFQEGANSSVSFDDIEPRYLGLYIGLAYSHSSIVPHTPPPPADVPETTAPKTPLRDYVEVYKICDRLLSPEMANFMLKCIDTAIGDGHRALFRAEADEGIQKILMRDFADAYESLVTTHSVQSEIANKMVYYFCEGVCFRSWSDCMEEVLDRPRFVGHVSRGFADKLRELQAGRKLRRKEMKGP